MSGRRCAGLFGCVLVVWALLTSSPASADDAPKSASITFSNLIIRLDGDPEIALLEEGYRVHILEYLRSQGYDAVGAENLVFARDNSDDAEFVVGGTIRELECHVPTRDPAACRIGIEWQLLHVPTDRVVYKVLARHAEYNIQSFEDRTLGRRLILGAVYRLLQRDRFRALLFDQSKPEDEKLPRASIATCKTGDLPLPAESNRALDGTALVDTGDGIGSGVLLNEEGYVLTAAHVVESGNIKVQTRAGVKYPATVLRVSKKYDVALLKAAALSGKFPCLSLNYNPPTAGSDVFVVGAPGGEELAFSMSKGIVSGLRTIDETQFIQTDASVNPGNSGGPMLAADGRVAAVMSFKIAGEAFEGLAFGVPVKVALSALSLSEGAGSDAALGTPVSVRRSLPQDTFTDTPDPMPEIDPEVVKRQQKEARRARDRERQEKLDAITPGYVKALRIGGYLVGGAGAVYAAYTYAGHASDEEETRREYEQARLRNDIGWIVAGAGAAAVITSYIIAPSLPQSEASPRAAQSRRTAVSLVPMGPLGLGVHVTY